MSARRPLVRLLAAAGLVSTAFVRFRAPAVGQAEVTVADPAGLMAADELPPVAEIEAAAAQFDRAAEQARTADRGKRAARKLLDRLPAGRYGAWQVEYVDNARETADLEAIRAIFKANGLGPVPVKSSAASLKVSRVEVEQVPETATAEMRVLVGAA